MTFYLRSGSKFKVAREADIDITTTLPPGTYAMNMTPVGEYYLQQIDNMKIDGKVYGETKPRAERIINTFMDRPLSTGVLLEGDKGSGKTFLAKVLAMKLHDQKMVTIVVNAPFSGDGFNEIIQNIDQPAMIFFDEFEKVYPEKDQSRLLTLFDGTYSSKKLFVVAINDSYRIVDMFKNRPGRFFYRFTYKGLDDAFIREYCEDTLKNKKEIPNIVNYAQAFSSFNFDMLKAIVEEMNRYNEGIQETAQYINATPTNSMGRMSVVSFKPSGERKVKSFSKDANDATMFSPFSGQFYIRWKEERKKADNKSSYDHEHVAYVQTSDLVSLQDGKFFYSGKSGEIVLEKYTPKVNPVTSFFMRSTGDDDGGSEDTFFNEDDDDDLFETTIDDQEPSLKPWTTKAKEGNQ